MCSLFLIKPQRQKAVVIAAELEVSYHSSP